MAVKLYKDITTDKIHTFGEIKQMYAESINAELPVDDDTMCMIILGELQQNGGNLEIVNDNILKWCNDYAKYQEADRYLSQEEKEFSVKNIYFNILDKNEFCKELKKYLIDNEEGESLLIRLCVLLEEQKYVYFKLKTSCGEETYICSVDCNSIHSIEYQCEEFLAEHCYCDAYEIIGYRDCTEEETAEIVNAIKTHENEWDAQFAVKEKYSY